MNTSEPFSNLQNPSEAFRGVHNASLHAVGQGRGKKYPGAEAPHLDLDRADFLIVEEAYKLFESQGERRSVRMIGQYCKTGELICTYDTDDKRWHITKESVEQKIAKIKAFNARRAAAMPQSTSEHFSEAPATPHRVADEAPPRNEAVPPQNESDPSPFAVLKKLRKRILNLRILNQGKDYVIAQLQEERGQLLTRIETSNRLVGELKHQLLQLEAPKGQTTDSKTPFDHAVTYREVEDVSSSHTINPTPSESPNEPLVDNINSYEQSSSPQ